MSSESENGWIEWNGGECPVDPVTGVVVRFGGSPKLGRPESRETEARFLCWKWTNGGKLGDIIAYRIVEQSK